MASVVFNFNRYDSESSDEFSFSENEQESGFVGGREIEEEWEEEVDPERLIEEEFFNIFGSEMENDDEEEFLKVLEFQFFSGFLRVKRVVVRLISLQVLQPVHRFCLTRRMFQKR